MITAAATKSTLDQSKIGEMCALASAASKRLRDGSLMKRVAAANRTHAESFESTVFCSQGTLS